MNKWLKALKQLWREPENAGRPSSNGGKTAKFHAAEVTPLLSRFRACLLGGAAGDALGYVVEFMTEPDIEAQYGPEGIRRFDLVNGAAIISDDTQMTMYTANGLLCGAAGDRKPETYYDCIAACYRDWLITQRGVESVPSQGKLSWLNAIPEMNSRRAPGGTCQSALYGSISGTVEKPINVSHGCGGVMRAAPIGLFFEDEKMANRMGAQAAAITHGHELGYLPAAALAHIVSCAAHRNELPLEEIVCSAEEALEKYFPKTANLQKMIQLMREARTMASVEMDDLEAIHRLGGGWVGEEALAIAIYCVLKYQNDFEKCIITAVNHRGDSDSTGAIAGNILGAYLGMDAIAQHFLKKLELRDTMISLSDDLYYAHLEGKGQKAPDWKKRYSRAANDS